MSQQRHRYKNERKDISHFFLLQKIRWFRRCDHLTLSFDTDTFLLPQIFLKMKKATTLMAMFLAPSVSGFASYLNQLGGGNGNLDRNFNEPKSNVQGSQAHLSSFESSVSTPYVSTSTGHVSVASFSEAYEPKPLSAINLEKYSTPANALLLQYLQHASHHMNP